jgi:hypothetical protein
MGDNLANPIETDAVEAIIPLYKRQTEKAAEQRGRQEKAAQAELLSQEAKYTKPAPEFKPTEESMSGFAAMGSLLAAAGAILGSNGRSSGLMAMNAVSGMMNGYNAGRKDLYEQQRQKFEESMKSWEKHREQVKDLFAQAAKLAPYNLSKAQQYLNDGLKSLGMQPLAEVNQRSGPIAAMSTFNRADQNMTSVLAKAQVQTSGLLNIVPPEQRGMFEQMLNSKDPKDVLAALEGLQAMKKTKAEADKSAVEMRLKTAQAKEAEAKVATGGLTTLDVGPYAKTIISQQTPENQKETTEFLAGKKTIDAKERDRLDTAKVMIDDSERVARYIAENPDAAGMLGQALGRSESVLGFFRGPPKTMDEMESKIDNGLDSIAKSDPSQRATAQKAAVLNKMLAALSLKDASATGRPTVFLERMISRWYNQGYPPDTLVDIIKERAAEADSVLSNYKLDTSRNTPDVNKKMYPLASSSVDDFLKQFRKAPANAGLNELSSAQKTGIQARIDQVNKDTSLTAANKKDLKDKIKKQIADGKFSDSGLNWGD